MSLTLIETAKHRREQAHLKRAIRAAGKKLPKPGARATSQPVFTSVRSPSRPLGAYS